MPKLLIFLCAVGGAATAWPILARVLAGGLWDVFSWRKIGFVGAAFFFCYFSFGQAKEK